jgi:RNA polymerase sigma-B factor
MWEPSEFERRRDRRERDELIAEHLPLAYRLARRFASTGESYEDLVQIASLGLVKAAQRFDSSRGTTFATFAVPTIVGELNRHLRDCTWPLHVNREAKRRARETAAAQRAITTVIGRRPSVRELANYLDCDLEVVVEGLQAAAARETLSLDARPAASESDLAAPLELLGTTDQHLEQCADVATIFAAAQHLSKRERLVLYLRFQEDLSQSEIARRLGVSQMHVSRIIRDALSRLRVLAGDSAAA